MSRRETIGADIDVALRQHRVVMLDGLPRVGRTLLVDRWVALRDDVEALPLGQPSNAGTTVHDHLDMARAIQVIDIVRGADWTAGGCRLVLVPDDLATLRHIETRLPGLAMTLRLEPMSLADCRAEIAALQPAQGAAPGNVPTATPAAPITMALDKHWLRGGLPQSLSAANDHDSLVWRRHLLQGLVDRDYSSFRVTEATRMPEFLLELARRQGAEFNEDAYAKLKRPELRSAIHVLERIGLVRRLRNVAGDYLREGAGQWEKVYVRDSGLFHALVGIETEDQLRNSAMNGDSFEGYAVEALVQAAGAACEATFFRAITVEGEGADEIDLILDFSPAKTLKIAIEMKVGTARRARQGFFRACEVVGANERFVVHSGDEPAVEAGLPRLDVVEAVSRVRLLAS